MIKVLKKIGLAILALLAVVLILFILCLAVIISPVLLIGYIVYQLRLLSIERHEKRLRLELKLKTDKTHLKYLAYIKRYENK